MTRRDLGSSSSELSELSGISIAFAGHDIVMACVRRLAGDGVYWDRLRVSGRVRGATCAAPRKNRRRRSRRVPVEPRRKPHHHTRRASERWAAATASLVAPRRRAARRPAPVQGALSMALFPVAAPRGARSRSATARAVDRSISTRSALFQGVVSLGGPEDGKAETVTKKKPLIA